MKCLRCRVIPSLAPDDGTYSPHTLDNPETFSIPPTPLRDAIHIPDIDGR